jgi:ABC-type transporter Mla MlaB component
MKLLQIALDGHLTEAKLKAKFSQLEPELEASATPHSLVVDCSSMTGYDSAARSAFIEWNKAWRNRISRVAIVTDNILWHMVIKMMSKVSSQQMKEFADLKKAQEWAQE